MIHTRTFVLICLLMSFAVFFSFHEYYIVYKNAPFDFKTLKPTDPKNRADDKNVITPLLVLFSTWPDDVDVRVRNNTCYNWGLLKPGILPVLFTNSSIAAGECLKHGWVILPLTPTAAGGAPVLKFMFSEVMKKFNSTLYGYANGDILFGDDLLQTLSAVHKTCSSQTSPLLVVGVRTNIVNVTALEAASFKNLHHAAHQRGSLFISISQDYFITNRVFPWDGVPEVVVGRVAYDNWLVLDSIQRGHIVVDTTKTILAVHQTTHKGNFQGHSNSHEPQYNNKVLARYHKKINFMAGSTQCIPIFTGYSTNNESVCLKRNSLPRYCKNPYV